MIDSTGYRYYPCLKDAQSAGQGRDAGTCLTGFLRVCLGCEETCES